MNKVFVIGGANIDIYAKPIKTIIPKDSNPSKISFSYGGVARNIAVNLSNFNHIVSFISVFSKDEFGELLKKDLLNRNIDLTYALQTSELNSSTFLAILDNNDMYVGASDMEILNKLDIKHLCKLKDVIQENDYLIFDTNLEVKTIEYIASELKGIKIVDAISASKAYKLKNILNKVNLIKLNHLEAEILANRKLDGDSEIKDFILETIKENQEIIITKASELFIGTNKEVKHFSHNAYNEKPINVKGAGDALLSTYVHCLIKGYDIVRRAKLAMVAGIVNVESKDAVSEINEDLLLNRLKEIRIEEI